MDQTWSMRKEDIKARRPSKYEYGEEWKNSVGLTNQKLRSTDNDWRRQSSDR